jgi:hypothetical protein
LSPLLIQDHGHLGKENLSTEKAETLEKTVPLTSGRFRECKDSKNTMNFVVYKTLDHTDLGGKAQNGSNHAVSLIARKNV